MACRLCHRKYGRNYKSSGLLAGEGAIVGCSSMARLIGWHGPWCMCIHVYRIVAAIRGGREDMQDMHAPSPKFSSRPIF